MARETKNEKAWNALFERHNIIEGVNREGHFKITADEIKVEREPRLMTKFDQSVNLPDIFEENELNILPDTRSSYIIGKFKLYERITYHDIEPRTFSLPVHIEALEKGNIYSEAAALNAANISGIIEEIMGDGKAYQTISGRMGTGNFEYLINTGNTNYNFETKGSQMEIDGGFETNSKLMIIEAKNFKADDFNIRQLYYPYRVWENRLNKEVIPALLISAQDEFHFFTYKFNDLSVYNSIEVDDHFLFTMDDAKITMENIRAIFVATTDRIVPEPEVPFPQADLFSRVMDLLGLLANEDLLVDEVTSNYNFEPRQTDYYANSGKYLGLLDKVKIEGDIYFTLTDLGRTVMGMRPQAKLLKMTELILSHRPFWLTMQRYLTTGTLPSKYEIADIMQDCNLFRIGSRETYERRAQSVIGWLKWIIDLVD